MISFLKQPTDLIASTTAQFCTVSDKVQFPCVLGCVWRSLPGLQSDVFSFPGREQLGWSSWWNGDL